MTRRLLALPARRPAACLALAAAVTALLAVPAGRVQHRYEIEDFFPRDTPERIAYERVTERFGRDDRTCVLLAETPRPGGLDGEDLAALGAAARRLEALAQVERVASPATVRLPVRTEAGIRLEEAVPPGATPGPERAADVRATLGQPPYRDALASADGRIGLVAAVLKEDRLGFADRRGALAALEAERARLEAAGFTVHLGGYPVQRVELAELAGGESATFLPLALGAILLLLALALRSAAAVALPLLAAAGAAVWVTGAMELLGLPPNVFGPAVYVMVVVVGVTDAVHLLTRLGELTGGGLATRPALERTLVEVVPPCAWASLTTAFGFTTLVLTDVPMVAHMGLQVAIGVVSAFALTVLLAPAAALWLPARRRGGAALAGPGRLVRGSLAVHGLVARRPGAVLLAAALVAAAAALGASRVRVSAPLLSDLDPDHPLRRTNRLLEERLGGAIPLDLVLEAPEVAGGRVARAKAAYERDRLERVDALVRRLRADPDVLHATSIVDLLDQLVRVLERVPPEEAAGLVPTALLLVPEQTQPWLNEEARALRIDLRIRDVETDAAFRLFERIEAAAADELGEPVVLTGQGYLAQVANRAIVTRFQRGFLTALAGVTLVLLVVFRDPRLALASLPPNLFPVLGTAGVMGLVGIDLRYTSALVLTVVFGIAVDDTIHFVAQLRRVRDAPDPVRGAFEVAGPGLVLTSAVLAAGFAALLASAFAPLRIMGGLLVLTAGLALAADLLLLPALLRALGWGRRPGSP